MTRTLEGTKAAIRANMNRSCDERRVTWRRWQIEGVAVVLATSDDQDASSFVFAGAGSQSSE
jgi:hypothetical protein